jgi:hypothetical protein
MKYSRGRENLSIVFPATPAAGARHRVAPGPNTWGCGMKTTDPIGAARLALLLAELRLPAVKQVWPDLAAQADKEGWPAARFLAALAEHEMAERSRRRIERHLAEARLPLGKTLDTFDFGGATTALLLAIASQADAKSQWDRGHRRRRLDRAIRWSSQGSNCTITSSDRALV